MLGKKFIRQEENLNGPYLGQVPPSRFSISPIFWPLDWMDGCYKRTHVTPILKELENLEKVTWCKFFPILKNKCSCSLLRCKNPIIYSKKSLFAVETEKYGKISIYAVRILYLNILILLFFWNNFFWSETFWNNYIIKFEYNIILFDQKNNTI